jgi:phosphatidylserine decarboxylase
VDEDVEEPWLPGGRAARVTVFLSLTDVHVNRSPVEGQVTRQEELGDGFAPALFRGAQDNRRNRISLDGPAGPVVVVQVAGALARTITSWVGVGDKVAAGERLGIIHFGSRTDVLLPRGGAEILVSRGTRVTAGVTPLARLRERG